METVDKCGSAPYEGVTGNGFPDDEMSDPVQSKEVIEKLKMDYANLRDNIENTINFSMNMIFGVRPSSADIDTESIMSKMERLVDLANKIVAKVNVHNRTFPDDKVDGLSESEFDFIKCSIFS